MSEPVEWFLIVPRMITDAEHAALVDGWRLSGLGRVLILENMQPVRITADGLRTPDGTVPLTDDQFEQLLESLEPFESSGP